MGTFPVKLASHGYQQGDVFNIRTSFMWFKTPKEAQDFTVVVYTKQKLSIKDSDGNTNELSAG